VGVGLWMAAALLALILARIVPLLRARIAWEAIVAVVAGLFLGLAATAMDFGGWNEADWRAGAFVFFGSAAAIAVTRLVAG